MTSLLNTMRWYCIDLPVTAPRENPPPWERAQKWRGSSSLQPLGQKLGYVKWISPRTRRRRRILKVGKEKLKMKGRASALPNSCCSHCQQALVQSSLGHGTDIFSLIWLDVCLSVDSFTELIEQYEVDSANFVWESVELRKLLITTLRSRVSNKYTFS